MFAFFIASCWTGGKRGSGSAVSGCEASEVVSYVRVGRYLKLIYSHSGLSYHDGVTLALTLFNLYYAQFCHVKLTYQHHDLAFSHAIGMNSIFSLSYLDDDKLPSPAGLHMSGRLGFSATNFLY